MPALLAIVVALLVGVLAGCGEEEEPEVGEPTVTEPQAPGGSQGGKTGAEADGQGGVALEEIGEFDQPVFVTQRKGDSALYVVEKGGRVVRAAPNGKSSVVLDISNEVSTGSEQGLLSVAFHPESERRMYAYFTDNAGDTRVVEYTASASGGRIDERTARPLMRIAQPYANHNGGLLLFDREGNLLVGLGDGGSAGDPERAGQDLGALLGKILRVDPSPGQGGDPYSIPKDNPFADQQGARPEILAYGLRNPWRFSFDRKTGALWIGDVGQNELEEIDVLSEPGTPDANFGWSAFEGTERLNEDQEAPDAIDPVLTYGRDLGCSVTGGYVVRDPKLESLYSRYLYADFCQGQLRSFTASDAEGGEATDDRALGLQVPSISSFGEDEKGRIYAVSLDGPVFRLVP